MDELPSPVEFTFARKVDLVLAISQAIGTEAPRMSTGSSEPRQLFGDINTQLGLGLDPQARKPDLARGIVEASGANWLPDYESRGDTITRDGLVAVYRAVYFFLR